MKENTHIVIKREDILKYLKDAQIKYLDSILNVIASGRKRDGKRPITRIISVIRMNLMLMKCLRLFLKQKARVRND